MSQSPFIFIQNAYDQLCRIFFLIFEQQRENSFSMDLINVNGNKMYNFEDYLYLNLKDYKIYKKPSVIHTIQQNLVDNSLNCSKANHMINLNSGENMRKINRESNQIYIIRMVHILDLDILRHVQMQTFFQQTLSVDRLNDKQIQILYLSRYSYQGNYKIEDCHYIKSMAGQIFDSNGNVVYEGGFRNDLFNGLGILYYS